MLLSGSHSQTSLGGYSNPYITSAAFDYSHTKIPYCGAAQRSPGSSVVTRHFPVEASSRAVSGSVLSAYMGDFYNRIHISPRSIELGNVVSTQTTPVQVWNAYLTPVVLTEIVGLDEGLLVSGQPDTPFEFAALKELTWQLSVTPDGQPVLDTQVSWAFANTDVARVRVTANRIIAWSFAPDWSDGIHESLEWLTDIQRSETMVEQRRALRQAPRRTLAASMSAVQRERQLLDSALFGWGSRMWALPIWPDVQLLNAPVLNSAMAIACSTQHLDFMPGGLAMLRGSTAFEFEVVEVLQVQPGQLLLKRATQHAWPLGTRLYPARPAQLAQEPVVERVNDQVQRLDVEFLIHDVCDWPAVMPSTLYRGRPVLEIRPEESRDLTSQFERLLSTLDSGLGLPLLSDIGRTAMPALGWAWVGSGRAERAAMRSLLYALRGQQAALWLPTHADDITLASTLTAVSVAMEVANLGYTRFASARAGRRDIRIELHDGRVFYRRISSSAELSGDIEQLIIDAPLAVEVAPAQVARICWINLVRGASDNVQFEHITDSEGPARCSMSFTGVRDDEF